MKRYERQTALLEIGISGQQRLAQARVLIIGLGGLGCPVLQNLAAAGVGKIGIFDGDVVEESNLHRQYLYVLNDCGKKKVVVAADVVSVQNPSIEITPYPVYFTKENAFEMVSDYQIIVDCSDNIAARYLINDVAVAKGIPMVYASIHKYEGQLSVFNYKNGPTYRCLFPENENFSAVPNCNDSGVLGVLPNMLGTMQANEVIKIILGIGQVLSGELLLYNTLDNSFQNIKIQKNKNEIYGIKKETDYISVPDFFTNGDSLIIDIREEYEEPKLDLENIKNVPLSALDQFLTDVDKNRDIILFCQFGNRSKLALDYLIRKGFLNVSHIPNGLLNMLSHDKQMKNDSLK